MPEGRAHGGRRSRHEAGGAFPSKGPERVAGAPFDIPPSLNLTVAAYAEWEGIPTAPRGGIELPLSRFGGFLLLAA